MLELWATRVRGKSAADFRRTFDARLDVIRAVVVARLKPHSVTRAEEVMVASEGIHAGTADSVLCDIRRELREGVGDECRAATSDLGYRRRGGVLAAGCGMDDGATGGMHGEGGCTCNGGQCVQTECNRNSKGNQGGCSCDGGR